jgi:predicted transposase YdaD
LRIAERKSVRKIVGMYMRKRGMKEENTFKRVCERRREGRATGRCRDREKAIGREAPMMCSMGITERGIRHEKVSERHERVRRPDGYDCHHHHPATQKMQKYRV